MDSVDVLVMTPDVVVGVSVVVLAAEDVVPSTVVDSVDVLLITSVVVVGASVVVLPAEDVVP